MSNTTAEVFMVPRRLGRSSGRRACVFNPIGLVFVGLLSLLVVVACNRGDDQDPCAGDGTLFEDSFDGDPDCGWVLYNDSGLVAEISDGALRLSTSQAGKITWTNANRNFDDLVISVRARQVSGPNDNAYGIICRYVNAENFYVFLISGDGYYAIGKYETGRPQVQYLTGDGQYAYSDLINQGVATNDIQASCIGDQLSLSVNGLPLASVADASFSAGDIGFGASTLQPGTSVIEFDDARVVGPRP